MVDTKLVSSPSLPHSVLFTFLFSVNIYKLENIGEQKKKKKESMRKVGFKVIFWTLFLFPSDWIADSPKKSDWIADSTHQTKWC